VPTAATSYSVSGLVDWRLAALFIVGGAIGGVLGVVLANRLSGRKQVLSLSFAGIVLAVGIYVLFAALTR
jgi:uncharacterized protein